MFSTIQSPSRSFTWRTLSLLPSPMSTNGSSSAPMWTAVGTSLVIVMASRYCRPAWQGRPCHTDGMPAWVPAALGLVLFWGLVVFVLILVFRRPAPVDEGDTFSSVPDAADTAPIEHTAVESEPDFEFES